MAYYHWVAIYKDGTSLSHLGSDGKEHSSEEIDRSKLMKFVVYCDKTLVLIQHFEPGQRLIYRRRTERSTDPNTPDLIVHLVGWQKTVHGENVQHINYIFEGTGHLEAAGAYKKNHPWFYPITEVLADKQVVGTPNASELQVQGT